MFGARSWCHMPFCTLLSLICNISFVSSGGSNNLIYGCKKESRSTYTNVLENSCQIELTWVAGESASSTKSVPAAYYTDATFTFQEKNRSAAKCPQRQKYLKEASCHHKEHLLCKSKRETVQSMACHENFVFCKGCMAHWRMCYAT